MSEIFSVDERIREQEEMLESLDPNWRVGIATAATSTTTGGDYRLQRGRGLQQAEASRSTGTSTDRSLSRQPWPTPSASPKFVHRNTSRVIASSNEDGDVNNNDIDTGLNLPSSSTLIGDDEE